MSSSETPIQQLVESLQERAKELNCLYRVDEILAEPTRPIAEVCQQLVESVPPGWKYPEVCADPPHSRGTRGPSALNRSQVLKQQLHLVIRQRTGQLMPVRRKHVAERHSSIVMKELAATADASQGWWIEFVYPSFITQLHVEHSVGGIARLCMALHTPE